MNEVNRTTTTLSAILSDNRKDRTMAHPHHFEGDKHLSHRLFDIGVPIGLFLAFYIFYNNGVVSPSEAVKTTGLWAISLLALTLLVGPASKIFPFLDTFKANRKVWGVLSFWIALLHFLLVAHFFWKWNLGRLIDFDNPRYNGILTGLLSLVILGLVTWTSNKKMIAKMDPSLWKIIQTTSYLALVLAVLHFYYMEQKDGVLVIKRLLGQVTFWFSAGVIALRLLVLFLPSKKK